MYWELSSKELEVSSKKPWFLSLKQRSERLGQIQLAKRMEVLLEADTCSTLLVCCSTLLVCLLAQRS